MINISKVFALDSSAEGIPLVDLLDTDWTYDEEELGYDEMDRQNDGFPQPKPHLAWRILGITEARWDVALTTAWDWFTRIVCLWIVCGACLSTMGKKLRAKMKEKTDQWREMRDQPPRRGFRRVTTKRQRTEKWGSRGNLDGDKTQAMR